MRASYVFPRKALHLLHLAFNCPLITLSFTLSFPKALPSSFDKCSLHIYRMPDIPRQLVHSPPRKCQVTMGKMFTMFATCVKIYAPLTTAWVLFANQMVDDPAPKSNSMWLFWTHLILQAGFSGGQTLSQRLASQG